ncbi:YisL family protein [Terribacillus sp. DMT04]|uniref:YisL family protein n=1 Tax=Terribacillus sp. DMT04 TaxID=2850441 RepID=UPI0020B8F31E|nr:YisL family protein [Terribacillus sp. DMT04]
MDGMILTHIIGWGLGIVLFFAALVLYNEKKSKQATIPHMILRLDYLVILYTGFVLLWRYFDASGSSFTVQAIIKGIAGLIVVICMEMILVKMKKEKSAKAWWIIFFIALVITLLLGFGILPMGFLPA